MRNTRVEQMGWVMAADWPEVSVEEIAALGSNSLSTGPFGSAISSKFFTDFGVPVIRGSNLSSDVGVKLIDEGLVFVSFDKAKEFSRSIARRGDLIFTCWGTINQIGIIHDKSKYSEYVVSNKQMKLTVDPRKINPNFLYYVFSSPEKQQEILSNGIGAAVPGFNLGQLKRHKFKFPPLSFQQNVVQILGALDDKIALNRRINQTLEAMAQAIFKSWFVDFEPVKAKIAALAEGRDPLRAAMSAISGKPEEELDALPTEGFEQLAATAALFPDEMVESELGEIPKGWAVRVMPDCIEVNPSRSLKKGALAQYLDMANVPTNSARVQNVVVREFSSGSKFRNGDTLLARITPCLENGKTAFVDFLNGDEVGWGSTEFIVLRPKNRLPESFAYFLCRHPDFRAFAIAQMAGTSGRQRVPNNCFGGYKLVEPSMPIAIEFGRLASTALNQIKVLDEEAKTLAALRDTLLPKLLSGELSVAECAVP